MSRRVPLALLLLAALACAAQQASSPGSAAPPGGGDVVAILDGEPIRREDLGAAAAFRLYRHQVDVYSLLKRETEKRVDERLLARAAEARATTPEALIAELESKAEPIAEAEVDRYLADHPGESQAPADVVRARVRHYLEQTRRIEQRLAFMARLREQAGYEWLLSPPEQPRSEIDVADAPVRGEPDAAVIVVHFASLGAAPSARSAARIARLRREFPGEIRQVHRNSLNGRDEQGLLAARVGALAQREGRFWQFHDAIFSPGPPGDALARAARAAGLGSEAVERASLDGELLQRVKRDLDAAAAAGVPRAPTLFVNGRYLSGLLPYEELRALVVEELARKPR